MTMAGEWFDETFATAPLMAILRGFGVERSLELAATAWDLGIAAVEIPVRSTRDLEALEAVAAAGSLRGRPVGAGTILSRALVLDAAAAGAAFTVSPGLDSDVAHASAESGMPNLPGVATATEIQAATGLGLRWVKAFPAAQLGSAWFTAMRGPFPMVNFVATGGMSAANASEFLAAGCSVIAVGAALEDPVQLGLLVELCRTPR